MLTAVFTIGYCGPTPIAERSGFDTRITQKIIVTTIWMQRSETAIPLLVFVASLGLLSSFALVFQLLTRRQKLVFPFSFRIIS